MRMQNLLGQVKKYKKSPLFTVWVGGDDLTGTVVETAGMLALYGIFSSTPNYCQVFLFGSLFVLTIHRQTYFDIEP